MGFAKLLQFVHCFLVFAQVSSRAINISTTWSLPQEAFPHFFRFYNNPATWDEAQKVCKAFEGELLTVENEERRDAVRAYLKELDVLEKVWIGLQRSSIESPFVWTGGGINEPLIGDGFWQEPPPLEPERLCIAVNPLMDFRWLPLKCSEPEVLPFICQLPVPSWAKGCLVNSLPSLTVTYLLEHRVIELLSDCGLSGTRRIACKGEENQQDLIKRLSCDRDEEAKNSTTGWAGSSKGHHWDTSTPSDWSNSISSQITRSSGTRHKRESRGTSTATDSSVISTSDSTWEEKTEDFRNPHELEQNKHTTVLEITTAVASPEKIENNTEENKGEFNDLSTETQTSIIESDNHQSTPSNGIEPLILTSHNSDGPSSISETISIELRSEEPITGLTDNTTQTTLVENGDSEIIPLIALEAHETVENVQGTPFIEIVSESLGTTLEELASPHSLQPQEVKEEEGKDASIEEVNITVTPSPTDDHRDEKVIEASSLTEAPVIVDINVAVTNQQIINDPATPDVDEVRNIDDVVILDSDASHIEFGRVQTSVLSSTATQEHKKIDPQTTEAATTQTIKNENGISSGDAEIISPMKGKDALQKFQFSSSLNKLDGKVSKGFSKLETFNENEQISEPIHLKGEETAEESKEAADLPKNIPIIVIAGMDEVEGKEHEDVEEIQPFTLFEKSEPLVTSTESEKLTTTTESQMGERKVIAIETTQNPVNFQNTEAVPVTGRPLVVMIKNDSAKGINESNSSPFETVTDISRINATNEPKDTVSDSTTKVQTLATPTQAEVLLADEASDELETHKRPNRGRIYSHSGTLSFYPYFLNRVLG